MSSVNSETKPHTPSHPLTVIQAKTTTTTTTLPHNLKFQQQPKCYKLAKETLKENVDTLTTTTTASSTLTAQTSSNLKSKGNNNSNTFFTLRKKIHLEKPLLIFIFLEFFNSSKEKVLITF